MAPPGRGSPAISPPFCPTSAAPYCEVGVAQMIEVKVPDIGDFKNIDVIEVLVKPGDRVSKEASLITLESDKATMEIPSSDAGVVRELRVKVGDKVSQGTVIAVIEGEATAAAARIPASPPPPASAPSRVPVPTAEAYSGAADISCDTLVLGSGPGGYSAAFRSADLGMNTVL